VLGHDCQNFVPQNRQQVGLTPVGSFVREQDLEPLARNRRAAATSEQI
jgi:hypothetical protein